MIITITVHCLMLATIGYHLYCNAINRLQLALVSTTPNTIVTRMYQSLAVRFGVHNPQHDAYKHSRHFIYLLQL
jgi:hypothetical protein